MIVNSDGKRYYVWHDDDDSAGGQYGHAFGLYDANTPGQARRAFLNEWDFDEWCEPLHIIKWRPCETCNGTGQVPTRIYPDSDWNDAVFMEFCPDCVLARSRKQKERVTNEP